MPDGFDPGKELQRILTLRDLIVQCRERAPTVMEHVDAMLAECDSYEPMERLALLNMVLDRGFGKATQAVKVTVDPPIAQEQQDSRVKLYLPDNGRGTLSTTGKVIDA